jgi:outer membrane lipoprotein-sorting protein
LIDIRCNLMTPGLRINNSGGLLAKVMAFSLLLAGGMLPVRAGEETPEVLARMDRAAPSFKGFSARVRHVSHTAVINEDTVDSGTILLKRSRNDMRMLVDLTEPDPKSVALHGDHLEVYYPKMNTVEEYDVGKNRALVEQLYLIGFGSSGADLAAAYHIKDLGQETVADQKTTHLELIPKSKEVLKFLTKLEIWVPENGMYPVQQKFFQVAKGDYILTTYTNVKVNPQVADADLKLKTAKNAKHVSPQKEP